MAFNRNCRLAIHPLQSASEPIHALARRDAFVVSVNGEAMLVFWYHSSCLTRSMSAT
jgi:hypothetical protein